MPDDLLLSDFVERLLADQFPGGPTTVEIFVGRFPAKPEVGVPDPPEGRLLGTAVHRRTGQPVALEAVYGVPTPPGETLTRYEEVLQGSGWPLARQLGPSGPPGFLATFVGYWPIYQQTDQGPVLVVNALPRDADGTDLHVTIDWEMHRITQAGHQFVDPAFAQMPSLLSPPDVTLQPRSHGMNNNWSTEASAQTDKTPAELETYFGAQLNGLGWTRLGGEVTDRLAWSSWSLPGADKSRALLVVAAAFPGERSLSLRVERPAAATESRPPWSRRWPR